MHESQDFLSADDDGRMLLLAAIASSITSFIPSSYPRRSWYFIRNIITFGHRRAINNQIQRNSGIQFSIEIGSWITALPLRIDPKSIWDTTTSKCRLQNWQQKKNATQLCDVSRSTAPIDSNGRIYNITYIAPDQGL